MMEWNKLMKVDEATAMGACGSDSTCNGRPIHFCKYRLVNWIN